MVIFIEICLKLCGCGFNIVDMLNSKGAVQQKLSSLPVVGPRS